MPPKPKYTREQIVRTAYEMTCENGIDSVVAREVGKRLGTSVAPIFTMFENMDDLKDEVREMAKKEFVDFMSGIFDFHPAFKEFGMRWIRFASANPHLYRLLFLDGQTDYNPYMQFRTDFQDLLGKLEKECSITFRISEQGARQLINQMLIHANGINCFLLKASDAYSVMDISYLLSECCLGIVQNIKLREGTFVLPQAKAMADSVMEGMLPERRTES